MSKEYGEFTVKFWADAELYAKEYGEEPKPDGLTLAGIDFRSQATEGPDDMHEAWRGAEIVKPAGGLVMIDEVRRGFMAKYDNWRAERSVLGFRSESMDDSPKDAQWEASDDGAVDLFGELASHLFDTDDCGHQNVTTSGDAGRYVVSCDDCPVKWTVKDGEVVAD